MSDLVTDACPVEPLQREREIRSYGTMGSVVWGAPRELSVELVHRSDGNDRYSIGLRAT